MPPSDTAHRPPPPFKTKLFLITLPVLFAAFAVVWGQGVAAASDPAATGTIRTGHLWLLGVVIGHVVSQIVSWRFAGSFSISATRMLLWSVVAYVAISRGIDILGHNWGRVGELVVGSGDAEVSALRALLSIWIAVLWLALTSILLGFERSGISERSE